MRLLASGCIVALSLVAAASATPAAQPPRGLHADSGPLGTASMGTEEIKVSTVAGDNLLPSFYFQAGAEEGGNFVNTGGYEGGLGTPKPFDPPDTCPDDVFDYTMEDLRVPVMPYLEQDEWGCERKPTNVSVIVLENEYLRAAITPQWGGKVWSLYDKKLKKQLFYNNPAHQPENIAYRKAWSSGGCEWNWAPGYIGHSVFTEQSTYAARIPTKEYGDVVRVWEFDRLNHTTWSVDIVLHGDAMWTHATITNPNEVDLKGYWWTCVAMRVTDKTRIVTPAAMDISPCIEWPYGAHLLQNTSFRGPALPGQCDGGAEGCRAWEQDMSWIGNIPAPHDFFMHGWRKEKKFELPYIAWVEEDGFAVMHAHGNRAKPHANNGTKFFTWGAGDFGKFQCDFMSASDYENKECLQEPGTMYNYYDPNCKHAGKGRYTELQIGPAHSQMHTFPLPKSSNMQWTEFFKGWNANTTRMHARDYHGPEGPVAEAEGWLASKDGLSFAAFAEVDKFLEELSTVTPKPEHMLYTGTPWGALHELATGTKIAPGAPFDFPRLETDPRTAPWVELLRDGTFSNETLARTPVSFEIEPLWVEKLSHGVKQGKATWLHFLYLGSAALERGELNTTIELLGKSMELKPSPHAARTMAIIAPDVQSAQAWYEQAWALWRDTVPKSDEARTRLGSNLASEMAIWYTVNQLWDALRLFLADVDKHCGTACSLKDRVLDATSSLAVHDGDYEKAMIVITSHCFPSYGGDRQRLIDTWYAAHLLMATAKNDHKKLTRMQVVRLRRRIGCDGDSTTSTWKSRCMRGPPNIGIAY